jgi:hypothetical protein
MNLELIFLGVNTTTLAALLLSIIFTAGVVWRVEMKLDISYKFFLAAIIFLLGAEILDQYYPLSDAAQIALVIKILRMLFAICFLIGALFIRNIIRKMDGEK